MSGTALLVAIAGAVASGCSGGERGDPDAAPDAGAGDVPGDLSGPGDGGAVEVAVRPGPLDGCNPVAREWDCLLPFPSDVFLVDDPSMPGGARLEIPLEARPRTGEATPIHPLPRRPLDGASVLPQILVSFPEPVSGAVLPFHDSPPAVSLAPGSPTLLVEAGSGDAVPHFSEVDPKTKRLLAIRPLVRLENGTRYVVALQGLVLESGAEAAPPETFRRLRDGEASGDPEVGALAAWYEAEVFPVLAGAGVGRAGLLLAWDFTTATEENLTGDMRAVRDLTLDALSSEPPDVSILEVEDDVGGHVGRRIRGTVRVPLFLDSAAPGGVLLGGAGGGVEVSGTADVPFVAIVPPSVLAGDSGEPARLLQYGHGFFGNVEELDGYPAELADEKGFVVVGSPWWGMSSEDLDIVIADIAGDPDHLLRFTERVPQGMAGALALGHAAMEVLPGLEPFRRDDGTPLYDPGTLYFQGNSMGHILGGVYLALAPRVSRGVLGVGGGGYSLIMTRSRSFGNFQIILEGLLPDPFERWKAIALFGAGMDRVDPIAYAPRVLADPYPGMPAGRRVLVQLGVGDVQVPTLAGHVHARALGLSHLQPAPRALPLLAPVPAPFDGSAVVEFDFGFDPEPTWSWGIPDAPTVSHDGLRHLEAAKSQIDLFLRPDAPLANACDGACDPE